MAIELSLCMIVKNEEKDLDNCLKSVRGIFDEINIVDTGSTDNTIEIAKKYTDRIFYYEWHDDFAAARNFSFSKATKEYIMWLDADDILTPENAQKVKDLKLVLTRDIQYVLMDYYCQIDENGNSTITQKRERIVKRSASFSWESPIHEYIKVSGKGSVTSTAITHNHKDASLSSSDRNFRILGDIIKSGKENNYIIKYYGMELLQRGEFDKSLKYLETFIEANKEKKESDMRPYKGAYIAYIGIGEPDKAVGVLEDNENILYDISEYYCQLGIFYRDIREDINKSLELFLKALESKGENCVHKNEKFYYYTPHVSIGKIYLLKKDYERALEHFNKAYSYRQEDDIRGLIEKLNKYMTLTSV